MEERKIIPFPKLKVVEDDLEVELEILPKNEKDDEAYTDSRKQEITNKLNEVNAAILRNKEKIDQLNNEINRLTNHADGIDYMVAVGSGVLSALIDLFWVGEFNIKRGQEWSNEKVNEFVISIAKKDGFNPDDYPGPNKLKGAIKHLEDKYHIPSDGVWNSGHYGINGISHRLDDWAHHPSLLGLFFSVLTQFTHKAYFSNKYGENISISAPIYLEVKKNGNEEKIMLIGNNIPSKFFCGVVNWFMHLVSDMAGSSKKPGTGMGIPGPIMTLLKEFSAIPGINKTSLPKKIGEIFEKNRFDFRKELAVGYEIGRQAIPVILNDALVRAFYFIRRLISELKEKKAIDKIDWNKTLPFNNRTIVRMLTIATSTFTIIDMADAVIRGALESGGNLAIFASKFILRVNFVGLGRCVMAVGSDVKMGMTRNKLRNERIAILSEQLHLMNAKIYYMHADMWIEAETTAKTINEAMEMMEQSIIIFNETWQANRQSLYNISQYREGIEKHNKGLIEEINDVLKWG